MFQMIRLNEARFRALLYRREPWAQYFVSEIEWWSNADESLIAVICIDNIDSDYSWVVLGRDETGVFRCIHVSVSILSLKLARDTLAEKVEELSECNACEFPQGDNNGIKQEILIPCVSHERLHPNFKYLIECHKYDSARGLLRELSYAFKDLDGNYKKDFQTTGFEGRLWELFLYAFFYEEKFLIDDSSPVPDFIIEKGTKLAVEAVTVNKTDGVNPISPRSHAEEEELRQDYMPIKWGSPLFSKLKKKYWENERIKGIPLVFAIHDYHAPGSMSWSLPALSDYLYGVRCDEQGNDNPIECHEYNGKEIPSGFFYLPDAENVSAVIASNEATLPKFNRMGKIAGFGDQRIKMERMGARLDIETGGIEDFTDYIVEGVQSEFWSSGIWVFHNPKAICPIDINLFPSALNVCFISGQRRCLSDRRYHILRSRTCFTV